MPETRTEFLSAVERNISSAELLLSKPEELQKQLTEIQYFLESNWPSIFATLNDSPLSDNEKNSLRLLLDRLSLLERKVNGKLDVFSDFQKYIQVSLEK